ncbi:MAG: aminotransferase class I/II-fold pyridoxal phosphate-dependent enzyme [Candidatus Cloacimonetes bacterium]|nr:aminotransferase class I/II-fold pyridoxal phosphate-dependent enzyme [Candidatus Cloacimonadota bacterium]
MNFFREDLLEKPEIKVNVVPKTHMMSLNESDLNPFVKLIQPLCFAIATTKINRYFSPVTEVLRAKLADYVGFSIKESQILFGNGVDDMLYFLFTAVRDNENSFALSLAPSYFDYVTYSGSVGLKMDFLSFDADLNFSETEYLAILNQPSCKLGIICNPNNPTGHLIPDEKINYILSNTKKPIIIDETYFEFSGKTYVDKIKEYPNIIITRSFSKSFSSAGMRFGYIIGSEENIKSISKVIPFFNTSVLTQTIANTILENKDIFIKNNKQILKEKKRMFNEMSSLNNVKVLPSYTNFLTFSLGEVTNQFYDFLLENDISVRPVGMHPVLKNHLRVTISKKESNQAFLKALKDFLSTFAPTQNLRDI